MTRRIDQKTQTLLNTISSDSVATSKKTGKHIKLGTTEVVEDTQKTRSTTFDVGPIKNKSLLERSIQTSEKEQVSFGKPDNAPDTTTVDHETKEQMAKDIFDDVLDLFHEDTPDTDLELKDILVMQGINDLIMGSNEARKAVSFDKLTHQLKERLGHDNERLIGIIAQSESEVEYHAEISMLTTGQTIETMAEQIRLNNAKIAKETKPARLNKLQEKNTKLNHALDQLKQSEGVNQTYNFINGDSIKKSPELWKLREFIAAGDYQSSVALINQQEKAVILTSMLSMLDKGHYNLDELTIAIKARLQVLQ